MNSKGSGTESTTSPSKKRVLVVGGNAKAKKKVGTNQLSLDMWAKKTVENVEWSSKKVEKAWIPPKSKTSIRTPPAKMGKQARPAHKGKKMVIELSDSEEEKAAEQALLDEKERRRLLKNKTELTWAARKQDLDHVWRAGRGTAGISNILIQPMTGTSIANAADKEEHWITPSKEAYMEMPLAKHIDIKTIVLTPEEAQQRAISIVESARRAMTGRSNKQPQRRDIKSALRGETVAVLQEVTALMDKSRQWDYEQARIASAQFTARMRVAPMGVVTFITLLDNQIKPRCHLMNQEVRDYIDKVVPAVRSMQETLPPNTSKYLLEEIAEDLSKLFGKVWRADSLSRFILLGSLSNGKINRAEPNKWTQYHNIPIEYYLPEDRVPLPTLFHQRMEWGEEWERIRKLCTPSQYKKLANIRLTPARKMKANKSGERYQGDDTSIHKKEEGDEAESEEEEGEEGKEGEKHGEEGGQAGSEKGGKGKGESGEATGEKAEESHGIKEDWVTQEQVTALCKTLIALYVPDENTEPQRSIPITCKGDHKEITMDSFEKAISRTFRGLPAGVHRLKKANSDIVVCFVEEIFCSMALCTMNDWLETVTEGSTTTLHIDADMEFPTQLRQIRLFPVSITKSLGLSGVSLEEMLVAMGYPDAQVSRRSGSVNSKVEMVATLNDWKSMMRIYQETDFGDSRDGGKTVPGRAVTTGDVDPAPWCKDCNRPGHTTCDKAREDWCQLCPDTLEGMTTHYTLHSTEEAQKCTTHPLIGCGAKRILHQVRQFMWNYTRQWARSGRGIFSMTSEGIKFRREQLKGSEKEVYGLSRALPSLPSL